MRRREFITLVGGAAATWPLFARAQQAERMRRIGVLMGFAENDSRSHAHMAAFRDGLQKLGWTEGRNIRIDTRWAAFDAESRQRFAKELITLRPDLILSHSTPTTAELLLQTRTIPIIFATVTDPVGSGFVASLPRPGGNVTGFTLVEPTMAAKWVELLKEIAPRVNRVAMLFNPATATYADYFLKPFKAAAPSFAVEAIAAPARGTSELESVVAAQVREPNGCLIVMPDGFMDANREEIISLAARYHLPAVYAYRFFTERGGLLSYGADLSDNFRRAAKRGRLYRSHPQGRKAVQSSGTGTDQVRTGHQPEDRQSARPRRAGVRACARRRGDRIAVLFTALHESAIGTKRTWASAPHMSALGGKADILTVRPLPRC
jgi:putative ABC transport system substrate-binding protein